MKIKCELTASDINEALKQYIVSNGMPERDYLFVIETDDGETPISELIESIVAVPAE